MYKTVKDPFIESYSTLLLNGVSCFFFFLVGGGASWAFSSFLLILLSLSCNLKQQHVTLYKSNLMYVTGNIQLRQISYNLHEVSMNPTIFMYTTLTVTLQNPLNIPTLTFSSLFSFLPSVAHQSMQKIFYKHKLDRLMYCQSNRASRNGFPPPWPHHTSTEWVLTWRRGPSSPWFWRRYRWPLALPPTLFLCTSTHCHP